MCLRVQVIQAGDVFITSPASVFCVTCSCAFSSDQGHTFSQSVRLVSLVSVQHTDICHCLPNATSCQQIHVQITLCSVLHVFLLLICVGLFKMSLFKYLCSNKYLTFTHFCGMHVVIMKYLVYYFIIEIYYTWIYHS